MNKLSIKIKLGLKNFDEIILKAIHALSENSRNFNNKPDVQIYEIKNEILVGSSFVDVRHSQRKNRFSNIKQQLP